MTAAETQTAAAFFTLAQNAIRAAKERDLSRCAALLDSAEFLALPVECQADLRDQYVGRLIDLGIGAFV